MYLQQCFSQTSGQVTFSTLNKKNRQIAASPCQYCERLLSAAPEAVTNLHVNEDQSALEWTAPGNEECVDHYAVCLRSTVLAQETCNTVSERTLREHTVREYTVNEKSPNRIYLKKSEH